MFDISFGELLLVAVVGMVFIRPEDLPVVLRAVARGIAWIKRLTADLRAVMRDLAKEAGVDDVVQEAKREVRTITGDDGKQYEAYDISDSLPPAAPSGTEKKP